MEEIKIIVPYPPSINRIYVTSAKPSWSKTKQKWYSPRFLTKEGRAYKKLVSELIYYTFPKVKYGDSLIEVHCLVNPPNDNRHRDHHNAEKILFDCIEASGIIKNDKQIMNRSCTIGKKIEGGQWVVRIKPFRETDDL